MIYYKDGVKMMRPIRSRQEYLSARNEGAQVPYVQRIRRGEERLKFSLVQMNYSCLPNADGTLKGSKTMSNTVGMDIDHLSAEEMPKVKERILSKKDELGLRMLEESARKAGYHLVFRRRAELSQEENLKWASELLDVEYDDNAKDITRVFFTTTEKELIFLDDEIFSNEEQGAGSKEQEECHATCSPTNEPGILSPLALAPRPFNPSRASPTRPSSPSGGAGMVASLPRVSAT